MQSSRDLIPVAPNNAASLQKTSGAPAAIKTIDVKLHHMIKKLTTISKDTENEFLDLGVKLQNFSISCDSNSQQAATMVQSIESGSGFSAVALMDIFMEVYREIETSGTITINTRDSLTTLNDDLQKIPALTQFLKKLAHSITVIGTLIRIETARIAEADFNVMTEEVDRLASKIAQGTQEINASVKESNTYVQTICANMEPFIDAFDANLGSARARIEHIVSDLSYMDKQAKWLCERIGTRASEINPQIGHIVSSLQFHDMTRQQIEHVCEAFDDILKKVDNHSSDDEKDIIILHRWAVDALKIQVAQLNLVMQQTQQAFDGISRPLLRISELVEAQAEDANLLLEEEQSGKNKLLTVGTVLDSLVNILSVANNMTQDVMNYVNLTASKLEGLTSQVASIETISESINLLALNAIIKVSRIGTSAKGLNVLAEEISKLSTNAKGKIADGTAIINAILAMTSDFKGTLSTHLTQQVESSVQLTKQTRVAISELLASDKQLIRSMNEISKGTKKLKTEIEKVVAGITFEKITKERLSNVIGAIEQLIADITATIPEHDENDIEYAPDLTDMLKRYTMQSERIMHEMALAGEEASHPSDAGPDMWGDDGSGKKDDEDSMGDNVELF
ncbi:methyl-accepting chemotaxis protein [Candidatus Magnetobacterium casense]|uniref:Methyl-accepting chemotaxis protein n=1 Tax=Candidatus Magnetobacterium casense TaxID=1455061 RepID=A0ABS6S192_9BACT|nr:methyl-accepting chemotaxis protein [Candidatus Magnetobacterium casensis]MBV6342591.1 methyl-accepting chemotaxis protein [Candidatus Magnetobacterium casensis]